MVYCFGLWHIGASPCALQPAFASPPAQQAALGSALAAQQLCPLALHNFWHSSLLTIHWPRSLRMASQASLPIIFSQVAWSITILSPVILQQPAALASGAPWAVQPPWPGPSVIITSFSIWHLPGSPPQWPLQPCVNARVAVKPIAASESTITSKARV